MGGKSTTSTQTVKIPPEVMARYNAVNERAEEVAKQPFQKYTGQFTAGLTDLQKAGMAGVNNAAGLAQSYYGTAADYTKAGAQDVGKLTADQIAQYQNPYTQSVIDPTIKALRQQQGQDLAQQQAQAIKSGGFGGDRAGIARAVTMGQQDLSRAMTESGLRSKAYDQAVQTAMNQQGVTASDLARKTQAGSQFAGLGTAAQTAALQGAQAQIGAGTLEQQTKQADLTANYQQFLQERGYPFQVAQFLANIAMGTGALSGSTTTTTQPAGIFSDERLKKDAKRVGQTDDGLPIYTYKYKNDDKTHMGVMAQDVEKKHPEAVGLARASDGNVYKTVDYGQVGEKERAYGGGLDPNSMGGAVYEPGEYSRGGYAVGGGLVSDTEARSMIAGMRRPAGIYDQAGLYGSTPYQTPYGPGLGIRGDAVPVPSLVMPSSKISAPESGLKQALSTYQTLKGLGDMGQGLYEGGEKALFGSPESKKDGEVVKKASRGLIGAGGQRDREKGYLGFAVGGRTDEDDSLPYGSDSMTGNQDIMSDVVQSGAGQVRSLPKPGEPPKAPDNAKDLMGLASMGKSAVEGFGSLSTGLSGLGSALGAGSTAATGAATAAGAAGAAGGLGSALGSIGSGIASIAPMFLAFLSSDERMKHNKQKVGELNDGQPVYRYDYGDGVTQLGLMAQDVEKHHPEAVMEHKGLKYVNYDRATEDAVHKYAGGLVYRQPHADGERVIPNYSEEADMPALGAIEVSAKEPDFRAIAVEKAKKHGVDADAMLRIIQGESSFNPRAVGDEGSSAGLGQFHVAGVSQKYPNPGLGDSYFRDRRPDLDKKLTPQEKIAFLSAPENQEDKLDYMAEHASKKGFGAWTVARKLGLAGAGNGVGGGGGGGDGAAAGKPAGLTGFAAYGPTKKNAAGEEVTDWKKILIPLLTGAAGMAAAPTRNFGTALAMGLGAGAQSYAGLDKQQVEQELKSREVATGEKRASIEDATRRMQLLTQLRQLASGYAKRGEPVPPYLSQQIDELTRSLTTSTGSPELAGAAKSGQTTLAGPAKTGVAEKPPAQTGEVSTAAEPAKAEPIKSDATPPVVPKEPPKPILTEDFYSKLKDDANPDMLRRRAREADAFSPGAGDQLMAQAEKLEAAIFAEGRGIGKNNEIIDVPGLAEYNKAKAAQSKLKEFFDAEDAAAAARVGSGQVIRNIETILEGFQTGKFADLKAEVQAAIRSLGFRYEPTDTVDAAAVQKITKEANRLVFGDVKAIGGQPRVIEFQQSKLSNPEGTLQPESNRAIIADVRASKDYADAYRNAAFDAYEREGWRFDINKFNRGWYEKADKLRQELYDDAYRNAAVRGTTPTKSNNQIDMGKLKENHVYIIEPGMKDPKNGIPFPITQPVKIRAVRGESGNVIFQQVQ